jgi:hypothetical protein
LSTTKLLDSCAPVAELVTVTVISSGWGPVTVPVARQVEMNIDPVQYCTAVTCAE